MKPLFLPFTLIQTGAFPCVEIHLGNKTSLFKNRDELRRREEAELWMSPAHKSLCADNSASTGIVLRLIVNLEFFTFQSIHHRPLYGNTTIVVFLHIVIEPCIVHTIYMLYCIESHEGMTAMLPHGDVVPDITFHAKLKYGNTFFWQRKCKRSLFFLPYLLIPFGSWCQDHKLIVIIASIDIILYLCLTQQSHIL